MSAESQARPSADGPAAPRVEIRALTGLRFVAAMWVVLIHFAYPLAEAFGNRIVLVAPLIMSGWLGVDLFFLLSGFVMVLTYVQPMGRRWNTLNAASFLWARIARIWPLWAVLTIGTFGWHRVTGYAPGSPYSEFSILALVEQLLMVHMWHRADHLDASFIPPGWSLSVEFLAYLLFPVAALLFWRIRRLPAVVLGVLAVGAMVPLAVLAYRTGLTDWELPWHLRIAGAFISGGLTCLFVERVRDVLVVRRLSPLVSVVCIVQIVAICYWGHARDEAQQLDQRTIAVLLFPVLVGALALSSSGPARVLGREALVVGGRISFALYLVHYCLLDVSYYLQLHVAGLAPQSSGWTLLQANMVLLSLLAAYLLWRFVEEPSRVFLRQRGPGRRPAPPRREPRSDEPVPQVPAQGGSVGDESTPGDSTRSWPLVA